MSKPTAPKAGAIIRVGGPHEWIVTDPCADGTDRRFPKGMMVLQRADLPVGAPRSTSWAHPSEIKGVLDHLAANLLKADE